MATKRGKPNKGGVQSFFLTLWPSDRKNKFCYAVRIYFQLCSPSNLLLIFSPHQASETCCTWVFRRKGRLCPTDFKWLLQCKCAQSRRGGSSSSASDTSPGSICYTDAPQCKECLRSVLPAAPHSSLRQPGAVGSRNISRQRVWSFLVLPGPACILGPLFRKKGKELHITSSTCWRTAYARHKSFTHLERYPSSPTEMLCSGTCMQSIL